MKKLLYSMIILSLGFFITSCDETTTGPDPVGTTGSVVITSTPAGAMIYRDSISTGKITPDTVKSLNAGTVNFTLKLTDYKDTTFAVTVTANQTVAKAITMTAKPLLVDTYNDIQLYERFSTVGFSSLILSTGTQVFSSAGTGDIFFNIDSLLSQHLRLPATTSTRTTYINNSATGTSLSDGEDSPVYTALSSSWGSHKPNSSTTYSFLYTQDQKYVKLIITSRGGGTGPGDDYRWIRVSYKINQTPGDRRF